MGMFGVPKRLGDQRKLFENILIQSVVWHSIGYERVLIFV